MLVAPLVLSTIVVGIAHMGDSAALGRIGVRALTWFITASLVSIGLGLVLVNLFQPGIGAPIPDVAEAAAAVGEVKDLKATEFVLSIFPKNAVEALATNNILQILVFSIFAGVALSAIGERGQALVKGAEALAEMMLQITGYVMRYAPFAVFGALAECGRGERAVDPRHVPDAAARVLLLAGAAVDRAAQRGRGVPAAGGSGR